MKSALKAGLLLLAALALPASVYAYGCPLFPCVGGNACTVRLGPWYLYYPYEAHFQLPAPVGYGNGQGGAAAPMGFPNWQAGAAVPVGAPTYAPPVTAPWQPPAPQPLVQPTGYIQPASYQQPPSYWYGNR